MKKSAEKKHPACYLHVQENRSGEEWIMPLRGNAVLDLEHQVDRWIKREWGGDRKRDGGIMRKIDGDYYARIMTDGRPPDSVVCWDGGGFYLRFWDDLH